VIALIDTKEADVQIADAHANAQPETLQITQTAAGFTAFVVRGGAPNATGTYALAITVDPP
jgi:hypothetical protein